MSVFYNDRSSDLDGWWMHGSGDHYVTNPAEPTAQPEESAKSTDFSEAERPAGT
ncbi:hypothetical protein [Streptomyces catenulae]|uniref:Uncharacterized protein n=1 Tax=Streptomyces catenulae TaxID=66875 RepID=A0ABV2Z4H8_9ACTN|nr:hypothetical protein [Streptomyces catenulae]